MAALPTIFSTPGRLFWIREASTRDESELAEYPTGEENTRGFLVLKRIAFFGVNDKLKKLQGMKTIKNNTNAQKSQGAAILKQYVSKGKIVQIQRAAQRGKGAAPRLGKFVLCTLMERVFTPQKSVEVVEEEKAAAKKNFFLPKKN